jgi:hypothetical protein
LGSLFSTNVNRDLSGDYDESPVGVDRGNKTLAASAWSDRYHMSRKEKDWLERFLVGDIPQLSADVGGKNDLQIHRFYQRAEGAGVGIVFGALASFLAGTDGAPAEDDWESRVTIARQLLEAYFNRRDEIIDVDPLLSGEEIISEFNLKQGPLIGELLQRLIELQIAEKFNARDQALDAVRTILADGSKTGSDLL